MAILKATFRDKAGKLIKTPRWYVDFADVRGKSHRLAGFTSRSETATLEAKLKDLVEARKVEREVKAEVRSYFDRPAREYRRIRAKLEELGLIEPPPAPVASRNLASVIERFKKSLKSNGVSEKQYKQVASRAQRVFSAMGVDDFTRARINRIEVGDKCAELAQGKSEQTRAFYIRACKQLTRWAVAADILDADPLAALSAPVKVQQVHPRRALTADECRRLLAATTDSPERWGMPGPVRALLYRLALETGLRANELRTLTKGALKLDGARPSVTAKSKFTKNKTTDELPLRPATAALLREHARKLESPDSRVFNMPDSTHTAKMLRQDIELAGIAYEVDGEFADFHSLRHTFVSNLVAGNVHPKIAQKLARHSTITLTMDRYSHLQGDDSRNAIAALPDLDERPGDKGA